MCYMNGPQIAHLYDERNASGTLGAVVTEHSCGVLVEQSTSRAHGYSIGLGHLMVAVYRDLANVNELIKLTWQDSPLQAVASRVSF
jgi:hypothetical protein